MRPVEEFTAASSPEYAVDEPKTVSIDLQPRKIPRKVQLLQKQKFMQLSKLVQDLKVENAQLRAENLALKQNIQTCRELLFEARHSQQTKPSSKIAAATFSSIAVVSCVLHYASSTTANSPGNRRLLASESAACWWVFVLAVCVGLAAFYTLCKRAV